MRMVSDEEIALYVDEFMRGSMVLLDNETEDDVIEEYFKHTPHENYTVGDNDIDGFICVADYDDYAVIHFAWFNGTYETRKLMVALGYYIYNKYTVRMNKPLFYQGKHNYFGNHCAKYDIGIWQFVV